MANPSTLHLLGHEQAGLHDDLDTGNGSWSPKGDLGLLGDLFLKTGLLLVSFLSKSLLFGRKLSKYGSFKGFRQNRWTQEYGAKVS